MRIKLHLSTDAVSKNSARYWVNIQSARTIHGRIVAPGDVDELEVAIRNSFLNPAMIPIVGRRNAELIKSHYTQSHYGEGLMAIYQKLMAH